MREELVLGKLGFFRQKRNKIGPDLILYMKFKKTHTKYSDTHIYKCHNRTY